MRKDSLNRSILKLAIPNIVSNITVPLLGFVDMMLMGHQDSLAYIGAIGLGGTIFSVMYSIFSFMRAGTTGFTAQAYGANDRAEIAYSLYRSLCIALIATVLVLSLQNAVEWLSMKLLNGGEEVLAYTATYFHVRIWAAPAVLCLYAFNGWYIGMQNTTIPMVIAILTNVVNIVLSVIFVNVMGMGVQGVALGTVIAQYCGLLTASMSSPSLADWLLKKAMLSTSRMLRIMKSALTWKKRFSLSLCSKMTRLMGTRWWRNLAKRKMTAVSRPQYCAMTVPKATPVTPMPMALTNTMLSAMLTTLVRMAMTMGMVVFCMPIYQPLKA